MAKNLIPRPMRAKNLLVKGDPAAQEKNFKILQKHLDADGYIIQQPKIDGMRILGDNGIARSRSWTPWTNRYLQAFFADHPDLTHGWDTEGLPGIHTLDNPDPEVFRRAMSGLRSEDGSPEMTLFLFDNWDESWIKTAYEARLAALVKDTEGAIDVGSAIVDRDGITFHNKEKGYTVKVIVCPSFKVTSIDQIMEMHLKNMAEGWEGSMVRRRRSPYKWNQATILEGWLMKIKDVEDDEAVITGFEVAYANENEATISPLGLTKRSSHQANYTEKDYLGAWHVYLLKDPTVRFKIGVLKGYTIEDRRGLLRLAREGKAFGKIVKFEHQGYGGGYDKPRAPVGISLRDPIDL